MKHVRQTELFLETVHDQSVVIGTKAAEKLCAVEGIEFTDEVRQRHLQLDQKNLNPEQRRLAIIEHYKSLAVNMRS